MGTIVRKTISINVYFKSIVFSHVVRKVNPATQTMTHFIPLEFSTQA